MVVQRSDLCNMRELPGTEMITWANEGAVAKASEATCKFSIFWGPCPKIPPFPSSDAILHNTHSWVLFNPISWLWPYKGSGIKVCISSIELEMTSKQLWCYIVNVRTELLGES